jgi:hypothetical protein
MPYRLRDTDWRCNRRFSSHVQHLYCSAHKSLFYLLYQQQREYNQTGSRNEEEIDMDYLGFITSLNPVILAILAIVLLAGAYGHWTSR